MYVPAYDPMVVYGSCWYPAYPPYYWPPPPVYGFGSPVVAGIGFGIGVGITSALWGGFDWGHHDVDINVTSSPSGATGFADTTVFDLMLFNQPWGRWGVGISGTLPTGENGLSLDKWTAGPAAGFVNSSSKELNWGLFAQTFFSFAGDGSAPSVGLINLQPILSYQLGGGRSLSLGNSALVYDMESSRWTSLLLSVNYGQVVSFLGYKWRPNFEVGYDFKDAFGYQQWVIRAGIALLVPK